MESYISNVCSQPVRPTTTANQVRAVGGQECFFDALHTQLSNNSPEGDGKSMQRRGQYRSAPAPAPAPTPRSEPLPAYKVAGQAERYDNCGCIKNPNPVRAAVKRIVGKPEYLVNALGIHFRNPLFVSSSEQSQAAFPPQKLRTKVKRAKKEAKKAQKEAQKAKNTALKAKNKAQKVQADALQARGMIQQARDVTGAAVREADLAEDAHVRAMRWATSVGNSAYGIRDETREALAEARQFSKKSDYCTHELV